MAQTFRFLSPHSDFQERIDYMKERVLKLPPRQRKEVALMATQGSLGLHWLLLWSILTGYTQTGNQ